MNPKDKALEIFKRHQSSIKIGDYPLQYYNSIVKNHAKTSIDIMTEEVNITFMGFLDWDFMDYWQEVKQEIEKL